MNAVKLDFTIGGREVWLHEVRDSDLTLIADKQDCGPESQSLNTRGGWGMPHYLLRQEMIDFARQFADQPPSIKLPYQLQGQDVWINSDRLSLGRVEPGISMPHYAANGPQGQWTQRYGGSGGWLQPGYEFGWHSHGSPQETANWLERRAGAPHVDVKTLLAAPVPAGHVNVEALLGPTLWAVVKSATPPPELRGLILAKTGLWVPEDVPDVVAWLQEHYKGPPVPAVAPKASSGSYRLNGSYSRRVSGTASFTATEHYGTSDDWTTAELRGIIEEHDNRDDMLQAIEDALQSDMDDNGCNNTTDYEYEDEETNNSESNGDLESNAGRVLDQFLSEHPELDPDYEEPEEEEEEDEPEEVEIDFQ